MAGDPGSAPRVIALDIGSSATRGCVFDTTGRPIGKRAKQEHAFTTAADGTATVDAVTVAHEVAAVLDQLVERANGPIAGVALDTFASSLVGVDAHGNALTPCFTYADGRCAAEVHQLRSELDEADVQQQTGCRIHASYLPARLLWLRRTQPSVFSAAHRWVSLGEFVHLALLGTARIGTSSAAWTGMLDRHTGQWDAALLGHIGISTDLLSPIADPDQPYQAIDDRVARRWPHLAEAVWFPPIADGLASNIGLGAADGATVALTAATSGAMRTLVTGIPATVPTGLWCYRIDARRNLVGGALNDVGRVATWIDETLDLGEADLDDIVAAPPSDTTPLMVPFLTGERSTGWAARARASFANVTAASTGPAMARAAFEGVATSYRRIAGQLVEVSGTHSETDVHGRNHGPRRIHAGGGLLSGIPSFATILANALELPVIPVTTKRTTLRGTALLALEALAPGSVPPPPDLAEAIEPDPAQAAHYARQAALFDRLVTGQATE
ncbi:MULTISPECIES: gluconokinase [Phycicoccus]|uniref:gluconokinase n=2 Tax=Intrasporangiaceae TaxID=85021 RepID=UPI001D5B2799|nr:MULTISPECIES: gluconokinase [Phycicoccus]MBK8729244.1 gluconokinase [Tetrasphaera sp.]MCA0323126.1 gluconokinase [Actinomycetota bacterium]MCB1239761.1 gluconokinase [Tetrasphaera sp.]MCB9406367.1 gluconokinase [Tetrasphaera sp.]HPF76770.1 gluconokinase [Phycicoccus elongatus]